MKKLSLTLFIAFFAISLSMAQNTAETTQSGTNHTSDITQSDTGNDDIGNEVYVTQSGNRNDAVIHQVGDDNNLAQIELVR